MHFAADISLTSVAGALQYRTVAARGAMLFFLLNSLNKIHAFYQYSLNAFVTVFSRAIDVAPGKQTVLVCPALHSMFASLQALLHSHRDLKSLPVCCLPNQMQHTFVQVLISACRVLLTPVHDKCANAGGRKKPVPKVTIMDLNRRMTGEPKDFQEVMEQARRVSQGGET